MHKYCNDGCKESYKSDREHGLIYGPIGITKEQLPKEIKFVPLSEKNNDIMLFSWDDGCKILRVCPYCFNSLQ